MKIRYLVIAAAALVLGGCASYGYRGGSGDYYYGQSSGHYGAPYGSVGYGTYGGLRGSVGYGYPGHYRGHGYWPRHYYGYRHAYGYYPGYYYGRPIIVRPRPDNDRPRDNRPNAPWRNLQGVTRVEHRERPERVDIAPARSGARIQGQRERIQPAQPVQPAIRPAEAQQSRSSPWRAAPDVQRQSAPAVRQRATPAPARRSAPRPAESRESDRNRTIER